MIDNSEIFAVILLKDGREWDRARLRDYTLSAAMRTVEDWKEKILREEPESELETVYALKMR